MKDGRSDPGHSKKRPQRAAGGSTRRGAEGSPRSSDGRRSSDNGGKAAGAPRRSNDPRRSDDPRRSNDSRRSNDPRRSGEPGRDAERRSARGEDRREQPEPGFGPFRGRQREGAPGSGPSGRRRVDEEARTVRSMAEEAVARASGDARPALRVVHSADDGGASGRPRREQGAKAAEPGGKTKAGRRGAPAGAPPSPRPRPVRDSNRLQEALIRGARALERGYEREALRILRPWREAHPDSADLRELLGLTYYRLGRWSLAQKELEAFVGLSDSTEQHPVLMDCARALGRFKKVETLWEELRAVSPAAEIVTEGRIVAAGALADQGRLGEAIKVLEKAPTAPKRVRPHHLRLWYALADLHERAGDIPAARGLFRKVSAEDPTFVDVAERLAALS